MVYMYHIIRPPIRPPSVYTSLPPYPGINGGRATLDPPGRRTRGPKTSKVPYVYSSPRSKRRLYRAPRLAAQAHSSAPIYEYEFRFYKKKKKTSK